jgi:hypothetical protein
MDTEKKPKVQIGATYQRPSEVETEPDMVRLQKALLGEKEPIRDWILWAVFVAIMLIALLIGWL